MQGVKIHINPFNSTYIDPKKRGRAQLPRTNLIYPFNIGCYSLLLDSSIMLSSAGVGRTGTYIALDYLLDQAAGENEVDMFECTKEMRARRPCMIQTEVG